MWVVRLPVIMQIALIAFGVSSLLGGLWGVAQVEEALTIVPSLSLYLSGCSKKINPS
ncbi:MAG: hypothetical protein HC876_21040 [Chloroflexaceae bacterium]|nr:hypothetical protein [Chloroflexaceae bacterium]